jgi:hypothetical protein
VLRFVKIDSFREFSGAWRIRLLGCDSLCLPYWLFERARRTTFIIIWLWTPYWFFRLLSTSCIPLANLLRVTDYKILVWIGNIKGLKAISEEISLCCVLINSCCSYPTIYVHVGTSWFIINGEMGDTLFMITILMF